MIKHFENLKVYTPSQKCMAILATTLAYLILGVTCLKLATLNENTSPFWLPAGLALGAISYFGRWASIGVFIGALLVNLTISPPLTSLFIASGNTLEAIVGSIILTQILKRNIFKQYSEFFGLFSASILGPIVGATIGTYTLLFFDVLNPSDFNYTWFTWWSGDFTGMLVISPLLLYWMRRKAFDIKRWPLGIIYFITLSVYLYFIFEKDLNHAYAWTICPLMILSGSLFGNFLSRLILFFISILIVILTKTGYGPFQYGNLNLNFLFMQSLLVCCSISSLFIELLESETKLPKRFLSGMLLGWCCIFFITHKTSTIEKKHLIDDLNKTINESINSLEKTLEIYTNLSEAGRAFISLNPHLTQADWREFTETLKIEKKFKAINGFGFVKFYKKPNHLKNILYWDKSYSDQFNNQYIITYLEPYEKNYQAIGFDIGSDPTRRQLAEEARRLRHIHSSRPVTLVQDPQTRKSFVIVNPIFDHTKNELIGWLSSPVITEVFFESSLKNFVDVLKISISYEGNNLYTLGTPRTEKHSNKELTVIKSVMIFNQQYDFEFYPTTFFLKRHVGFTIPLALLLNIFMLFITGFLIEQLNFGQKAERLVLKRTQELEDSKIQLIHSSKMASLGEMAGGMAHEINNPLTIIQGKIKILSLLIEEKQIDHVKVQDEILKIKSTTERIGKIIRGLRTFSRASDSDPFESIPLSVIFKETLDLCSEKFKYFGINLEIAPIPPVDIMCRPSQVSQVLLNLFNNSLDAIEFQEAKWITVDFVKIDDVIKIIVSDSGKPIDPSIADKIMEPFFTTKDPGKGTGLGLSISKGIIEGHRGKFLYNSNSKHTQFIIELPLA